MNEQAGLVVGKPYDEQREHFIERLLERYNIEISTDEYDSLLSERFHGVFTKRGHKTIGWMIIKGVKVWVLRHKDDATLPTCYPPDVEHSQESMIRACFSGLSRRTAFLIYNLYIKEDKRVSKLKFDTVKDAAIYFFGKTKFAPLHIDKFKHGAIKTYRLANIIDNILIGTSTHVTLSLRKKPSK